MVKVNNSNKGFAARYIVAKQVDGELWYRGGFNAYEKAFIAACNIGGIVLAHNEIDWTTTS